ncbi:hypothetical protein ACLKA7_009534 [Drosophila subpalustris]
MHAEDMSTLLTQHALQAADAREEHNDAKQLPLDQTDNIDGRVKCFNSARKHEADTDPDPDAALDVADPDPDPDADAAVTLNANDLDDQDMEEEDKGEAAAAAAAALAYHATPKYRRAIIYAPHEENGPQSEIYMDNNYNYEYKCKERNMRAIRCSRQHHHHLHTHPHPHPHLHPHPSLHHQVATAPQTALNLGRHSSAIVAEVAEVAYSPTPTATPTPTPTPTSGSSSYRDQQSQHVSYSPQQQQLELAHSYAHHAHHPPPPHPSPHYQPAAVVVAPLSPQPSSSSASGSSTSAAAAAAAAAAANRRDHNIDYSTLFVQLSGTLPTLYRCVSCNKIVSNRWHHANIHRPQSHECPVCGQKFTRRDNMKAHCKIKHADIKDRFFSHYVHM